MQFDSGDKKESVADKARRQRDERRRVAAAVALQRWWRRAARRRAAAAMAAAEWDGLGADAPLALRLALLGGGSLEATAPRIGAAARAAVEQPAALAAFAATRLGRRRVSFLRRCCVSRVCAADFVSGAELRLLVAHAAQNPPLTFDPEDEARYFTDLAAALAAKVKARATLLKHKASNEKDLKANALWTNAVLMILLSAKDAVKFTAFVLSVPLLVPMLDASGLKLIQTKVALAQPLSILNSDVHFKSGDLEQINGELSLFLLGNLVDLIKQDPELKSSISGNSKLILPVMTDFISAATKLLKLCGQFVKSKATNKTRFHPVLQWYSGPILDVPAEFHNKLAESLSFLWSRPFVTAVFADLLEFGFPAPVSVKPVKRTQFFSKLGFKEDGAVLDDRECTLMSVSCLQMCSFFYQLGRVVLNSTQQIYTSLSWTPTLIPRLWRLLNVAGPQGGFTTSGLQLFLKSSKNPSKEPLMPIFNTFCESCCILFTTLDDDDIYEKQFPFLLDELVQLSSFLNSFCFGAIWNADNNTTSLADEEGTEFDGSTIDSAQRLLRILYDQSTRRPFGENAENWIMKEVQRGAIVEDVKNGEKRAIQILNQLPQCIPFAHRVDIFRHMVKADKQTIGDLPLVITVRRGIILEDGFRQLGKITLSQLKQTIKVRFVNELGLVEAGIDQNGVFKEFLEDMCKAAFASDFGLFRTTDDGNCVPSLSSSIHDDHLQLLEFVGRIFGKALYEGIVIDIPFATFIYAKMLGRLNYFEDLPSLDRQLYKNLLFLKHYEGDAEDLDLNFTIDENVFGQLKSKEIKPGGSAITVTNENKYEYIHIMSDYRLNQECKAQFRALVGGFRSIMPERYIRFFSPRELQTLMSGENVDFDVSDLRRHTRYEGGYFDGHATIRAFWQVIEEMEAKEKNAFLKFVTSCSNPPVGGFRHLEPQFTIRFVAAISSDDNDSRPGTQFGKALGSFFGVGKDATRLPTASTCFNVLKLPAYQKKSSLKAKLLYAIKSGAGFELS